MTDRRPKIAALVADAFQEEEYFFPKIALNEAGYQVEVVSSRKEPVEIYSYSREPGCWMSTVRSPKRGPRTMWASTFQVVQRTLPCLPKIPA